MNIPLEWTKKTMAGISAIAFLMCLEFEDKEHQENEKDHKCVDRERCLFTDRLLERREAFDDPHRSVNKGS